MSPRFGLPILLGLLAACASPHPAPAPEPAAKSPPADTPPAKPNIDPAPRARPEVALQRDSAPPSREPRRVVPPEVAFSRGWMALASTGADTFRRAHPTADGRGVLIAILDTGIDPSVPGLGTTSTGERKVLDLRDFSGEGEVRLRRIAPRGDSVEVAGRRLGGFGRVAALNGAGPYYGGAIEEIPLGEAPAADLNANGVVRDTFPIVVTRASDGWVLFTDTDGDGSLANEKPVHDYLVGNETFGWAPRGRAAPLAIAANFGADSQPPTLDLFFDTGNHGTFVSGIAAGHDIYGVAGFDGVAPGAQLLGLKIANDAQGGVSTTGSMLRALDYAVRFAQRRRMPLVINMSFGVGNEKEGEARIDAIVDSVLAANPEVVMAVSAGNDGPGLSTLGFPGSAGRVLTVGGTLPSAFLPAAPRPGDQLASFSARGGELAKPDVIAPGFAYSTVPRFDTGDEVKQGTSFSAPQLSGIVALLLSALAQAKVEADARTIKQALMVTARPQGGFGFVDQGTGIPEVASAWRWLQGRHRVPEVAVRAVDHGVTAAFRARGLAARGDTLQQFDLTQRGGGPATAFTLRSDAPWIAAPRTVTVGPAAARVTLTYRASALRAPGVYTGVVSGWTADTLAGPAFRLVNTVIVPHPSGGELLPPARLEPGATRRAAFVADTARPFVVRGATQNGGQTAIVALHEPGGRPFRDGSQLQAGPDSAATFRVDGRDVVGGMYEADLVGFPTAAATAWLRVDQAPFRMSGRREGQSFTATLANLTSQPVDAELRVLLGGGERTESLEENGSEVVRIPFLAPPWARGVAVDVAMPPDQWERFTDFGVSLFDSVGRQLAKEPMNYALGRLQLPLAPGHGEMPLELRLFPGFADPAGSQRWKAAVSIRLYADSVVTLDGAAGRTARLSLPAGQARTAEFTLAPSSWTLPERFHPLGVMLAHAGGEIWTRELGLSAPPAASAR
jgi:tripeptidyl-peptidase-2